VARVILDTTEPDLRADVQAALEELGCRAEANEVPLQLLSDE